MPRVKIPEYRAKSLILGEAYEGIALQEGSESSFPKDARLVLKVDQGVKKRMKQGLVAVDIAPKEIEKYLKEWRKRGYSRFLVEPLLPHEASEEQYFSLERVREGLRLLHASDGGIDVEEHPERVTNLIIRQGAVGEAAEKTGIPESFLSHLVAVFEANHFAFLEINPLVLKNGTAHLLDAAVLVDSAGEFFAEGRWSEADIVESAAKHDAERRVAALQKTTPASLKLTVLNPNGGLFFLLSGGGGSIVAADEAALLGKGDEIANYGEYSGGPTREETYLYTKEVLSLLVSSNAKKKVLVIAGGVANFTDVKKTFAGIEDALTERAEELRKLGVTVYVRRGGPNEALGLSHMEHFLKEEGLFGSVHGSDAAITEAVDDAVKAL